MTQAKAKPYNPRGPQRASKDFRAALARVIPSYYQESGNVIHVKHEVRKYQYAQVSSAGTTTMVTVNPGSEHIQVDRGMKCSSSIIVKLILTCVFAALIDMFGGDTATNLIVDFCCGSGTASLAAASLGYSALALDNDDKQKVGFNIRLLEQFKKLSHHIMKAEQTKNKEGKVDPPHVTSIPFHLGATSEILQNVKPFSNPALNVPQVNFHLYQWF